MKGRFFIIAAVVFFADVSDPGWAIENPAIRNPVGFGTLPPSNIRSGLIRSPNPIDTSGNLVITGNIRGGRHFRGIVPYRASSYFGAVTGSSSLDSFLRGSVGSEDFGRYTGAYKPFYSPSRTVTTTRPGQVGVVTPPTAKIWSHTADFDAVRTLQSLAKKQAWSYHDTEILGSRFKGLRFAGSQIQGNAFWGLAEGRGIRTGRPMSTGPFEMERAILPEVDAQIYRDKDKIPRQQERAAREKTWMEQFRGELEQAEKRVAELEKSLSNQDESLRLWGSKIVEKDVLQPFELQRLRKQPTKDKQWSRERDRGQGTELDVYEQIEQQIDELQRSYEQLTAAERAKGMPNVIKDVWRTKEAADTEEGAGEEGSGFVGPASTRGRKVESKGSSLVDELSRFQIGRKSGVSQGQKDVFWVPAESRTAESDLWGMNLSARAKAILGTHQSFVSFSNDKFNQHLIVGERYLKEGKYYRSADAYTLALIYKLEEPLAYAGKSHALFAAGEYVSSALFLSRAIIAESKRCKTKDCEVRQFLALIAKYLVFIDRDKLEDRVVDLEGWQQRSGSAELQFLLGYIYYQMGKLDAAREAIDGAYEKMPEEPAVIFLKKTVDRAKSKTSTSNGVKSKKQPHQD